MQFNDGARVVLPDQREVGRLERMIIDPRSLEITDIVVSASNDRDDEKVIPVHLVASSTEDEVFLKELPGGWDRLEPYKQNHYLMVNQKDLILPADLMNHTAPILFIYPSFILPTGITYPRPEGAELFTNPYQTNDPASPDNTLYSLPDDRLRLVPGSRVISQDKVELGYVERLVPGSANGDSAFFVLKRGLLVKERKLVPLNWVENVHGKEVTLGVRARFLDWLPDEEEAE